MNNETMTIQSHKGSYQVAFGSLFLGLEGGLAKGEHLIIDARVADLYSGVLGKALVSSSVLRIEALETNKSLEKIPEYVTHLTEQGIKRGHTLLAVGGGIVQDITAFIAAVLFRGLPWKFYPTTLLAQADSCIGSKSSINVGQYKNQVGTFTPPQHIHIATDVLKTLNDADLRSGIGEIIKVHIIAGWDDFRRLAKNYDRLSQDQELLMKAIRRSLEIKKEIIEKDEFDQKQRLILNYGHTFGHAIESATHYEIPHGIAITIGMDMANFVSWKLGFISKEAFDELHRVIRQNYAGFENAAIPEEKFFAAISKDKKNVEKDLSLILMRSPGDVFRKNHPLNGLLKEFCVRYFNEAFSA